MSKQEVQPGAKCQELWDPYEGLVFRCVNPNGKVAVITKETFKQLEAGGVVERGESGQRYVEKSLG